MATNKNYNKSTDAKIEVDDTTEVEDVVLEDIIIEEVAVEVECTPEPEKTAETVLSEINETVSEISGNTDLGKQTKVKKATFDLTEQIPCKSLFLGKLIYTSPTNGARYIWKEFGSVEYIPFGELQTMNNHKPQYLNKPYILINESGVIEYFNLTPVYEKVANINKLDSLFKSGDINKIRKTIQDGVEVGMRDAIISKVRKMRQENTLVDINIIKALKEELKFDIE